MPAETLFSICNTAVLPAWLLLIALPRWKWTTALITSVVVPVLLGLVYLYLVVAYFVPLVFRSHRQTRAGSQHGQIIGTQFHTSARAADVTCSDQCRVALVVDHWHPYPIERVEGQIRSWCVVGTQQHSA